MRAISGVEWSLTNNSWYIMSLHAICLFYRRKVYSFCESAKSAWFIDVNYQLPVKEEISIQDHASYGSLKVFSDIRAL